VTRARRANEQLELERNGGRAKPGHPVRPGDDLAVRRGSYERVVVVRSLSVRRGPASQAAEFYAETEKSKEKGKELRRQLNAQGPPPGHDRKGRPSKKSRRDLERLRRGW
jgi:ribosome-associated heat shock protein Hsp15